MTTVRSMLDMAVLSIVLTGLPVVTKNPLPEPRQGRRLGQREQRYFRPQDRVQHRGCFFRESWFYIGCKNIERELLPLCEGRGAAADLLPRPGGGRGNPGMGLHPPT